MSGKSKKGFPAEKALQMTARQIGAYLNDREKKFAAEYLRDLNQTQAAIRAGYSVGKDNASAAATASRLMREPCVRAYRAALIRESVEDMDVSRESVVLKLLEIYQRCMAAVPVLEWNSDTQSWEKSGEWRFDARGAAKALEQLTKLLGLDAPVKLDAGGDGLETLLGALQGEKIY